MVLKETPTNNMDRKKTNKCILEKIKSECSLEASMIKLRLSSLGHIMTRNEPLKKVVMLGTIEGKRRRGKQRKRWIDTIQDDNRLTLEELRTVVYNRNE